MGKNTKRFIFGTIIAAITGYLAGILTAPKSGKETRKDIKTAAVQTAKASEKQLKRLQAEIDKAQGEAKSALAKLSGKAKVGLTEAMAQADEAKGKIKQVLDAAGSGKAEDKDLQKAVKEAASAVDHLKTFFTKS
ncbi:MAG TPA: YtxH domain-containing protein [Candidatus Binatia bacterium]|nr:YtxH domain-containing protein [Candidatus Binatia bacterium]